MRSVLFVGLQLLLQVVARAVTPPPGGDFCLALLEAGLIADLASSTLNAGLDELEPLAVILCNDDVGSSNHTMANAKDDFTHRQWEWVRAWWPVFNDLYHMNTFSQIPDHAIKYLNHSDFNETGQKYRNFKNTYFGFCGSYLRQATTTKQIAVYTSAFASSVARQLLSSVCLSKDSQHHPWNDKLSAHSAIDVFGYWVAELARDSG